MLAGVGANASLIAETIASRRNPLVARCRAIARGDAPEALLLDGQHLIDEARHAHLPLSVVAIESRLLDDPSSEAAALARQLSRAHTRLLRVTSEVMAALSPSRQPSGLVAVGSRPVHDLGAILAGRSLILVAVDVQDPGNLGAMIRVAHAARADACLVCGAAADPYGWKALRGSMGSAFHLPVVRVPDTREALAALDAHGIRSVATVPHGAPSLYDVNLDPPLAVLIGSEGQGLTEEVLERVDTRLSIPMAAGANSLNVAATASVVAYEIVRRRDVPR
jgi:TrmH family RNA methyltransferase